MRRVRAGRRARLQHRKGLRTACCKSDCSHNVTERSVANLVRGGTNAGRVPGRRTTGKLLTRDEARRIAAIIAKLRYCDGERLGLDELSGKRRICTIGRGTGNY